MGELHSGKTNVPISRRLATGKMSHKGTTLEANKLLQERRQDGSLNRRPKILLA
jgi:hypothetical protein